MFFQWQSDIELRNCLARSHLSTHGFAEGRLLSSSFQDLKGELPNTWNDVGSISQIGRNSPFAKISQQKSQAKASNILKS